MAELYERIEKMCRDRGVTITEMCKQSGASRGSLTDLKMGRSAGLSLETLEKLMKYFDVSLPELMGTETEKAPTENGERKVTDEDIKAAFWGGENDLSQEDIDALWEDARAYIEFKTSQKRGKKRR